MKEFIVFLFLLLGIASNAISQVQPADTDGDGFINISTLAHLRWVSENSSSWGDNFELDNNINAAATADWNAKAGFSPIGNETISFSGKFEGNGFAIDSLFINRPETDYIGLLGWASGSGMSNIGITNCRVTGNNKVGALIGINDNSSTVNNSYSSGSVSGIGSVGGLIGHNFANSTMNNSHSSCNVIGANSGMNNHNHYVGGLVGKNNDYSTVSNSYSTGSVSGKWDYVGGLVGMNSSSTVSNSYSTGSVSGTCDYVGGLVGKSESTSVINSYSTGSVSGKNYVGGLIGWNDNTVIGNCFWDTQTSGRTESAGGTGKTTAEMKTMSTFTNVEWNFNLVWEIDPTVNNGYPYINNRGIIFYGIEPKDTDGDDYINISCYSHIHWISNHPLTWAWKYELDNNINADSTRLLSGGFGFSPIGKDFIKFTGKFEGNGFAIDSLYVNRPGTSYIGLFGWASRADISNIGITNCQVIGGTYIGGLVGSNSSSTVSHSYSSGSVMGCDYIGGLVGSNNDLSTVSNSYSTCSVSGSVSGSVYVGGLVGTNVSSTVSDSYSTGNVAGGTNVGGLVGDNQASTVSNSYSIGSVSGDFSCGGLVGDNQASTVSNSYSTGSVSGGYGSGGLVGHNQASTVSNSYSSSSVSGTNSYVGGLVGDNNYNSIVSNSYSTGSVSGKKAYVGGLVGSNNKTSTVSNSFWDTQTSGITTSDGGTGKTTLEMKTKLTLTSAGWDFVSIWAIAADYNYGYPNLDGKNDQSGIKEIHSSSLIYPQPASDELFVRISETNGATAVIKLYDQNGRFALTMETSANDGLIRLNTSALASGVYQMLISINGNNYTEKVVVVK